MKNLQIVDRFRTEASNSLFNKAQAMAISMRLLQLELEDGKNTEEDNRALAEMMKRFDFRYLDARHTDIDEILDSANVARLTSEDILTAIEAVKFDCE